MPLHEIETPGGRLVRLLWLVSRPGGACRKRATAIVAPHLDADSVYARRSLRRYLNQLADLGFVIEADYSGGQVVRIKAPTVTFNVEAF